MPPGLPRWRPASFVRCCPELPLPPLEHLPHDQASRDGVPRASLSPMLHRREPSSTLTAPSLAPSAIRQYEVLQKPSRCLPSDALTSTKSALRRHARQPKCVRFYCFSD